MFANGSINEKERAEAMNTPLPIPNHKENANVGYLHFVFDEMTDKPSWNVLRTWNEAIASWNDCYAIVEWNLPYDTYEPQFENCGSFHVCQANISFALAYFIWPIYRTNFIAVAEAANLICSLPLWLRQLPRSLKPAGCYLRLWDPSSQRYRDFGISLNTQKAL